MFKFAHLTLQRYIFTNDIKALSVESKYSNYIKIMNIFSVQLQRKLN